MKIASENVSFVLVIEVRAAMDWLYALALGRARARLAAERAVAVGEGGEAVAPLSERLDALDTQVEAGEINENEYMEKVNKLRDNYDVIMGNRASH